MTSQASQMASSFGDITDWSALEKDVLSTLNSMLRGQNRMMPLKKLREALVSGHCIPDDPVVYSALEMFLMERESYHLVNETGNEDHSIVCLAGKYSRKDEGDDDHILADIPSAEIYCCELYRQAIAVISSVFRMVEYTDYLDMPRYLFDVYLFTLVEIIDSYLIHLLRECLDPSIDFEDFADRSECEFKRLICMMLKMRRQNTATPGPPKAPMSTMEMPLCKTWTSPRLMRSKIHCFEMFCKPITNLKKQLVPDDDLSKFILLMAATLKSVIRAFEGSSTKTAADTRIEGVTSNDACVTTENCVNRRDRYPSRNIAMQFHTVTCHKVESALSFFALSLEMLEHNDVQVCTVGYLQKKSAKPVVHDGDDKEKDGACTERRSGELAISSFLSCLKQSVRKAASALVCEKGAHLLACMAMRVFEFMDLNDHHCSIEMIHGAVFDDDDYKIKFAVFYNGATEDELRLFLDSSLPKSVVKTRDGYGVNRHFVTSQLRLLQMDWWAQCLRRRRNYCALGCTIEEVDTFCGFENAYIVGCHSTDDVESFVRKQHSFVLVMDDGRVYPVPEQILIDQDFCGEFTKRLLNHISSDSGDIKKVLSSAEKFKNLCFPLRTEIVLQMLLFLRCYPVVYSDEELCLRSDTDILKRWKVSPDPQKGNELSWRSACSCHANRQKKKFTTTAKRYAPANSHETLKRKKHLARMKKTTSESRQKNADSKPTGNAISTSTSSKNQNVFYCMIHSYDPPESSTVRDNKAKEKNVTSGKNSIDVGTSDHNDCHGKRSPSTSSSCSSMTSTSSTTSQEPNSSSREESLAGCSEESHDQNSDGGDVEHSNAEEREDIATSSTAVLSHSPGSAEQAGTGNPDPQISTSNEIPRSVGKEVGQQSIKTDESNEGCPLSRRAKSKTKKMASTQRGGKACQPGRRKAQETTVVSTAEPVREQVRSQSSSDSREHDTDEIPDSNTRLSDGKGPTREGANGESNCFRETPCRSTAIFSSSCETGPVDTSAPTRPNRSGQSVISDRVCDLYPIESWEVEEFQVRLSQHDLFTQRKKSGQCNGGVQKTYSEEESCLSDETFHSQNSFETLLQKPSSSLVVENVRKLERNVASNVKSSVTDGCSRSREVSTSRFGTKTEVRVPHEDRSYIGYNKFGSTHNNAIDANPWWLERVGNRSAVNAGFGRTIASSSAAPRIPSATSNSKFNLSENCDDPQLNDNDCLSGFPEDGGDWEKVPSKKKRLPTRSRNDVIRSLTFRSSYSRSGSRKISESAPRRGGRPVRGRGSTRTRARVARPSGHWNPDQEKPYPNTPRPPARDLGNSVAAVPRTGHVERPTKSRNQPTVGEGPAKGTSKKEAGVEGGVHVPIKPKGNPVLGDFYVTIDTRKRNKLKKKPGRVSAAPATNKAEPTGTKFEECNDSSERLAQQFDEPSEASSSTGDARVDAGPCTTDGCHSGSGIRHDDDDLEPYFFFDEGPAWGFSIPPNTWAEPLAPSQPAIMSHYLLIRQRNAKMCSDQWWPRYRIQPMIETLHNSFAPDIASPPSHLYHFKVPTHRIVSATRLSSSSSGSEEPKTKEVIGYSKAVKSSDKIYQNSVTKRKDSTAVVAPETAEAPASEPCPKIEVRLADGNGAVGKLNEEVFLPPRPWSMHQESGSPSGSSAGPALDQDQNGWTNSSSPWSYDSGSSQQSLFLPDDLDFTDAACPVELKARVTGLCDGSAGFVRSDDEKVLQKYRCECGTPFYLVERCGDGCSENSQCGTSPASSTYGRRYKVMRGGKSPVAVGRERARKSR